MYFFDFFIYFSLNTSTSLYSMGIVRFEKTVSSSIILDLRCKVFSKSIIRLLVSTPGSSEKKIFVKYNRKKGCVKRGRYYYFCIYQKIQNIFRSFIFYIIIAFELFSETTYMNDFIAVFFFQLIKESRDKL